VSTGNVPQLVMDLLINSLGENVTPLQRIGILGSPYVLNFVGPDAFGNEDQLSLPIEGSNNFSYEIYILYSVLTITLKYISVLLGN
jgi:proteasome assembly chaperone 2